MSYEDHIDPRRCLSVEPSEKIIESLKEFSRASFLSCDENQRAWICIKLEAHLAKEIIKHLNEAESEDKAHDNILRWVKALKIVGHDLWRWDYSDNLEIWGTDYAEGGQRGIIVEFYIGESVKVWWRDSQKIEQDRRQNLLP